MVQRAKHILGIWESWAAVLLSASTPFCDTFLVDMRYKECLVNSLVMKILPQKHVTYCPSEFKVSFLNLFKWTWNMYLYFHLLPFSTFKWISPFVHYFCTNAMFVTFLFITSQQHSAEIQFAKARNIDSDNNAAN